MAKKQKSLCRNGVHFGTNFPHNDEVIPYLEEHGNLPFELMPFQEEVIKSFADEFRVGIYADVGTGKTIMAIALHKYKRASRGSRALVIMPPILLHQWAATLRKTGEDSIVIYAGTPAQRKALSLDAEWILVGMEIFKLDFERIYTELDPHRLTVIVDEAVSIKNPETENHKSLHDFIFHSLVLAQSRRKRKAQKKAVKEKSQKLSATAESKKAALLKALGGK